MIKLLVIIFFSINWAYAISITEIRVSCAHDINCSNIKKVFNSLKREYKDIAHIKDTIKLYVANEGIKSLNYSIESKKETFLLNLDVDQKNRVVEVHDVDFSGDKSIELPSVLPLRRDDFLDKSKIKQTIILITEVARDKGYPDVKVFPVIKKVSEGVEVKFRVDLNEPIVVKKINISSKSEFLKNILWTVLGEHRNQAFDAQKIKSDIEEARKVFLQYGYYLSDIELKIKNLNSKKVILFVNIRNTRSYVFYLKGLKILKEEVVKKYLANALIGFKREMSVENVSQSLIERFELEGFKESVVVVEKEKVDNKNGETAIYYKVHADEGVKIRVEKVNFKGITHFEETELREMFFEKGTSLISSKVHDEKYYEDFMGQLRELYIQQGYVSVFIDKPLVKYDKKSSSVVVTYRVREGVRAQVKRINIEGLRDKDKEKVLESMSNKVSGYFNPISFQQDLSVILEYLKNEGYYFSEIKNMNAGNLVQYRQDNSQVYINLSLETGLKLFAGDIIIIGNNKTRKILIQRELQLEEGELITIEKIESSQVALLSLGIFSSVQIQPVSSTRNKTDVLVFVREKDFGSIEIAPGIRTDIGLKISTVINYNNIDGMNKRISFKGSVNRRLNLNSLDPDRRRTSSSLIEYDAGINYSENHLFHSDFDFNTQILKSRKRFYSFDADIQRLTLGLSKDFTKWFNSSIKYQIETISQFDATVDREHGHFQIGSITPAVTFDFRNRSINPTKGSSFNFSCEFANPTMLSQQNEELTINYYKLMNRNKFYIPMSRDVVLAISTAFGIQENQATGTNSDGTSEGYIPNIKVFRLTGADNVRGYEDDEINRLISKDDISEVEVNSRAYMANLKFEPRLMLSDSTILGVFYDAGRIFVDEFKGDSLRSSVGVSFKYVTPVGTLDFDYGIKLLRKRDADGTLDSPGRLHVSIGFF